MEHYNRKGIETIPLISKLYSSINKKRKRIQDERINRAMDKYTYTLPILSGLKSNNCLYLRGPSYMFRGRGVMGK